MQLNTAASKVAQSRPANTTAATLFTASVNTEITRLICCNVSGSDTTVRVFHAASGGTFDEDTALLWDVAVPADTTLELYADSLNGGVSLISGDLLGVRVENANAVNFTAYGVTQSIGGDTYGF